MVTGLHALGKLLSFKSAGGMGTQVPILAEKLNERGIEVAIDSTDECDIVHLHNPMPQFIPLIKKVKKMGKPLILHARHLPELVKGGFKLDGVIYPLFNKYSRWLYNQADVVICATPYVKKWMEANGIKSELVVIPNGVECTRFAYDEGKRSEFRKKYGLGNEWVVFSVGLLIPRKGVLDFIHVAKNFEEVKFLWIGSTEPGMKKIDVSSKPQNVTFIGHIPFAEIPSVYSGGDIFFFPTYAESYGNVLFEAAAAGRALIIRDIEVYKEWLEDGVNCMKGKSVEEYTEHIEKVIRDKSLQKKLRDGALKLAQEHDIEKSVEKLIEVYTDLIKC